MLDNAKTIIDTNVHVCMLMDRLSNSLYYRGSRGKKYFLVQLANLDQMSFTAE